MGKIFIINDASITGGVASTHDVGTSTLTWRHGYFSGTITVGTVSATGAIIGSGTLTIGTVSATGNIIGGATLTIGTVSATGNVIAGACVSAASGSFTALLTAGTASFSGNLFTTGTASVGGAIIGGTTVTAGTGSFSGNFFTTGTASIGGAIIGGTMVSAGSGSFSGTVVVADSVYGAAWDGSLAVPTRNAVYDKIQQIASDVLFDYFVDATVGGAEADIYSSTIAASQLGSNGDKIIASYGGNFVTVGTELTQLKVYFAGTAIWDSTGVAPSTGTTSWRVYVEIIRVSATVIRFVVSLNTSGASGFVYCTSGELTALTLSGTNILKITGTSSGVGSGAGDIVGKQGYVEFKPLA